MNRDIQSEAPVLGETPALGYTVAELIQELQQYPPDAPVGMCVGPHSNLALLSLYQASDGPRAVWFDLAEGEPE